MLGVVANTLRKMASAIFVKPVLALEDNFMYIVACPRQGVCALVDPVEPDKLLAELATVGPTWAIKYVLTTHHHWDHAGGNKRFHELHPDVPIYGGDSRVDAVTKIASDGEKVSLGDLSISCMTTPCHTSGHICYLVSDVNNEHAVFTGDTLFIAGCGKFFEGTAAQMYSALVEKLGKLDQNTNVFCGHEYTINNLKFARHVEPDNADIAKKLEWALSTRSTGGFTVPSTIREELRTNPFMRVTSECVQRHAGCVSDAIATMAKLREQKNNFKAV